MIETIFGEHFIAIIIIFGIYPIRNGNIALGSKKIWTEQDEVRRIQQIMEAEEMEYEMEQRSHFVINSRNSDDEVVREDYHNYPITESYQYKGKILPTVTFPNIITTKTVLSIDNTHWCYYCTSPLSVMSGNMQRAIEKFLLIRRTAYPVQVKNTRCSEPRNLTELAVEYCRHPYCQTLILTDHETGSSFTMRGCAETFGAINEKLLDAREDNTCQRLHEQLDIQECICRHRRYCYPGAKRQFFDDSGATIFMPSSSANNIISIFYYILFLKFAFYNYL